MEKLIPVKIINSNDTDNSSSATPRFNRSNSALNQPFWNVQNNRTPNPFGRNPINSINNVRKIDNVDEIETKIEDNFEDNSNVEKINPFLSKMRSINTPKMNLWSKFSWKSFDIFKNLFSKSITLIKFLSKKPLFVVSAIVLIILVSNIGNIQKTLLLNKIEGQATEISEINSNIINTNVSYDAQIADLEYQVKMLKEEKATFNTNSNDVLKTKQEEFKSLLSDFQNLTWLSAEALLSK